MERSRRVQNDRRTIALRAYERWKGFQPDVSAIRGAESNRDGTIPRPKIAAPTPEQRIRFIEREMRRQAFESAAHRDLRIALERKIGATLDFVDLPPNEQALKAGRPVVRIVTMPAAGIVPQGFASGFLVAPDLLITNYHVFRTADEAHGVGAQFLFERTQAGLREGLIFELEPQRFFLNHKTLDYAVVAVKTTSTSNAPLSQFKFLPLIAVKGKIKKGDPVNIIQYPNGEYKRYATINNQLLDIRDDGFLLYETDTLEGSSGSPVFNQSWETIALHHCGVPRIEDGKLVTVDDRRVALDADVADSDLQWIANEGVRISAIVESFATQRLDRPEQQAILSNLISLTGDPLQLVEEVSPLIAGKSNVNTVDKLACNDMAQNIFNFAGPVTIHIAAAGGPVLPPVIVTPEPPPEVPPVGPRPKTLKFDEDYQSRDVRGYKPDFLVGWNVPAPAVDPEHSAGLLNGNSGSAMVIPYYHYSLVMSKDRRLVVWTACNVDYSTSGRQFVKARSEYGGDDWRLDPRVALAAPGLQIENADFYAPAKKIDRGHVVRRDDSAWGENAVETEYANSDTFHWSNCTPQSEAFNQSAKKGIWGKFEDHIQKEIKAAGGRMNVFAGPVLNPNDPTHGYPNGSTIQVPMEFWKIVVCVGETNGGTERLAYGFVFDQTEPVVRLGFERLNMDDFKIYQMPIAEITKKTGVVFDESIRNADVMKDGGAPESIRGFAGKRIVSLENIVLG